MAAAEDGRDGLKDATHTTPQQKTEVRRASGLDSELVDGARLILCDLDGCLMSEGRPFPDAPAFVAACGARLRIVSNRSDTTAEMLSRMLERRGLSVPPEHILMAGEVTLLHLADRGVRRLELLAAPPLVDAARRLGVDPRPDNPEAILLCRDPGQTVDTLGPLAARAMQGVPLWVSNEDMSHPDHYGGPVAETGALLAALRAIAPALSWRSLGKPAPSMLLTAMTDSGIGPEDTVFVGDNAATDGRAAAAAGLPLIHVIRGETP